MGEFVNKIISYNPLFTKIVRGGGHSSSLLTPSFTFYTYIYTKLTSLHLSLRVNALVFAWQSINIVDNSKLSLKNQFLLYIKSILRVAWEEFACQIQGSHRHE